MSYKTDVLALDPVAFLHGAFDANFWYDETENGLDFARIGPTDDTNDTPGDGIPVSFVFDGEDDLFEAAHDSLLNLNAGVHTIVVWVKRDGTQEGFAELVGKSNDDPQLRFTTNTSTLRFDSGGNNTATGTIISDATWYMVSARRSADGNIRIFVDGGTQEAINAGDTNSTNEDPMQIGCNLDTSGPTYRRFFTGRLASVALFDTDLTVQQLDDLFAAVDDADDGLTVEAQHLDASATVHSPAVIAEDPPNFAAVVDGGDVQLSWDSSYS